MNSFLRISLLFILIGIVFSCKKEDKTPAPGDTVIAKESKVISEQTWDNQFVSIDSSNYTITFSDKINSVQPIKAGDIIISSSGEGLLRKVKSVTPANSNVIVQTEAATLTDVVQQGVIEYDQPLAFADIKSVDYYYSGIKLRTDMTKGADEAQFNWDINTVIYDFDGNHATTNDQIKLVGSFGCNWNLALKIDIGFFSDLKEVKFGFQSTENLNLKVIAGMEYSFEKKVTLASVNFTPITVWAGAVPVVFTPQLKITAGVDGSANASITSEITQSMTFSAGIQYLKGRGWAPYNAFTKSFQFQPPQLNLNASAGGYLKPEISIKVYSVAGPFANLKLYSRLDANILQTPWWSLYGGISMNAGAKVDILNKFLLEYTVNDILKYETVLAQASVPPVNVIADVDGNGYKTVQIGTQTWMAENLKTTKYKDGTAIPLVTTNTSWDNLTTAGYCWYNNDAAANKSTYGALYNWYAVNTGKLCPAGWHVPTDADWTTLTTHLGGESIAGGKLKETGTSHWLTPNTGATNETGFLARPGGLRSNGGAFSGIGSTGSWWSSTADSYAWYRLIYNNGTNVNRTSNIQKNGYSVRCVKD